MKNVNGQKNIEVPVYLMRIFKDKDLIPDYRRKDHSLDDWDI